MGFSGAGDTGEVGLIPGLGRPPGVGRGNPLHYSCLEKSMDREACQEKIIKNDKKLWPYKSGIQWEFTSDSLTFLQSK